MKYTLKAHLSKVCVICEQSFYASRVTQLYCTKRCSKKAYDLKKIEERDAAREELQERVVLRVASAAIPPQNVAYRWLYQKPDVHMAVPLAAAVHKSTDRGTQNVQVQEV